MNKSDTADHHVWPAPRDAWLAASVLFAANALAFLDRQAMALLIEPIERDLDLSDVQIGLLYGAAFTLFYLLAALPLARLADAGNRRNLICGAVLLWSVATSASGMLGSFGGLIAARMGVGAGEGALSPAASSLLADFFPPDRLARAVAVYQMGIYVGGAAALLGGAALASVLPPDATIATPMLGTVRGWQVIFLVLGVPGLAVALLLLLLVREPERHGAYASREQTRVAELIRHVGTRRGAYGGIIIGFALMILVGNGFQVWIPTFFERRFGWTVGQVGITCGAIVLVCGSAGTLTGGWLASQFERRRPGVGNLIAALIGFVVLIPLTIILPLLPNAMASLAAMAAMNVFAGLTFGGGIAALQLITPNRMRAIVSAGYMLAANVIGAAGGPALIAAVADYGLGGPQRLAEAMALVATAISPIAALALWFGVRRAARLAPTA